MMNSIPSIASSIPESTTMTMGPRTALGCQQRPWHWIAVLCFVVVGGIGMAWDVEISKTVRNIRLPGDVSKAIHLCEAFAHTAGCAAILAALLWIDIDKRAALWKVAILTAICGIVANLSKIVIPRVRPNVFESVAPANATSWNTWGTPLTETWFDETIRSFPSGHSAIAVAMAIGLSHVYPRGRWIFTGIAIGACFQRLYSGAHFLSDILASVAMALAISMYFYRDAKPSADA